MKNINKYRTPQDKMVAWAKWVKGCNGCAICTIHDCCADEMKSICFNAWLHSTTEKTNEKQ